LQPSRGRKTEFKDGVNNVDNVADVVTADGGVDDEREPVSGAKTQHFQVQVLVEDQFRVAAKTHRRRTAGAGPHETFFLRHRQSVLIGATTFRQPDILSTHKITIFTRA